MIYKKGDQLYIEPDDLVEIKSVRVVGGVPIYNAIIAGNPEERVFFVDNMIIAPHIVRSP